MNPISRWKFLPTTLCVLSIMILASSAGALMNEIDLGGDIDLSDESGVYVTVMSRYFRMDSQQVKLWYESCLESDDLAVTLFLSQNTGKSPAYVIALRNQGLGWWDISEGMGVNPNDWFLPAEFTLRPPYSAPYWKWSSAGESGSRFELSDADCRNLIGARFLHQYFEVTLGRAMEMRANGANLERLSTEEFLRKQKNTKSTRKEVASGSTS